MEIQVVIRDLYGQAIFNHAFDNLSVCSMTISIFLKMFGAPVGHILFLTGDPHNELKKTVFKVVTEDGEKFLRSQDGQKILLPPPPDGVEEELDDMEDEGDEE